MLNKAVVSLKSKRQVTVFVSFIVLITIIFVGKITAEVPPVREDISLRRLFEEVRDKGWIVFCARSDKGDWDLFTCRPDGNALQNITQIPEYNEAAHSFLDFACYVSFFPQLLSGPIQSYGTINAKSETTSTFADQLAGPTSSPSEFSYGAALFVLGFAKKVLLAEVAGQVTDAVFAAEAPGTLDVWFGASAYTFQLYFDFSAYSEMAIGVGSMFGFECPRNFNAPYRAKSITEFWKRWHISLSSWFRDHQYMPLGGNRKGIVRSYFNIVVVFLLCGLWNGTNWTFIVWGAITASFSCSNAVWGKGQFILSCPGLCK